MICPSCLAYEKAERAAIAGTDMPAHEFGDCTCEVREMDVLYVSPEQFSIGPQVGTPCRMMWHEFALYLSRHSVGEAKGVAGSYSCALYRDNVRRKAHLVHAHALVADIDENGDVDAAAEIVAKYSAIVHETFTSTNDAPRCRIVFELAQPIDAATYERVHNIIRPHLALAGLLADEGAKDASRLSYSPVRRAGAGYRFRLVEGNPLDAAAVLAAQPPPAPRRVVRPVTPAHRDQYVRAALRRAAAAVGSVGEGMRHYTLSKEAFALARLDLSEDEVAAALLPAFVGAAGPQRQNEGARTIRDAVRARRGVS